MQNYSTQKRIIWLNKLITIDQTEQIQEDTHAFKLLVDLIVQRYSPELFDILKNEKMNKFKLRRCDNQQYNHKYVIAILINETQCENSELLTIISEIEERGESSFLNN